MSGVLNAYGSLPVGAVSLTVVIPATQVDGENDLEITDFGATAKDTGTSSNTNTDVSLETSVDGSAYSVRDTIQIVQGGTVLESLFSPVRVPGGQFFRVRAVQSVATKLTASLKGRTLHNDIVVG